MLGLGNGNPLQYSCLENPMDGGAWWAGVHGVPKSRTRLSDFTFTFHFHALAGNPLQCSCLENPRDRGAWWAAVYGVAQGWTWLEWLSSSRSRVLVAVCGLSLAVAGMGSALLPCASISLWRHLLRSTNSGVWVQQLWCKGLAAPQHVASSWTRDRTHISRTGGPILYYWTTRPVSVVNNFLFTKKQWPKFVGFRFRLQITFKKPPLTGFWYGIKVILTIVWKGY